MAKQFMIMRQIGTMQIVAGQFATLDLPRDYDYAAIFLRLSGSVTVSVGATSVRAEAPCQWVPRVEVIADGKNTIFSAPLWATSLGNVDRPIIQSGARATTPPTAATAATYAVEANGIIDQQFYRGMRPKDSNFRSDGLSLFQIRATFGQPGDIFVGGTVAFSGTPTLEVYALQCVEERGNDGVYMTKPYALKKVSYQEQAFTASNANAQILLPAGNAIKSVLVRTEGATTAGEPGTGVLNNLQLANGVDVRFNLNDKQTRAKGNADCGQITAGYYVADFTNVGSPGSAKLTDLWDVSNANQPKAIMDVTGGANVKVQVVTTEMILAQ